MKIYNSLGKHKQTLTPLQDNKIGIYACGITPYSDSHLGHGVAAIRFNCIRQYLKYRGYEVTYVQNVTNVDDKLIKRGNETGQSPIALAEKYTAEYRELMDEMGIELPDSEPDVISFMPQIIQYIQEIIDLGYAYATEQGNVYFDVRKKDNYGKLSGRNLEEVIIGSRKAMESDKINPLDFALWKQDDHPELSWESPWGQGRPGWHIECSVMSNTILGSQIDIHCGGLDLMFPHHENEIAQCEAHNACDFANVWVHSGLLNVGSQKMSKSLGNFFTLREAVDKYGPELMKFMILRHHYRSDINFTDEIFSENLNAVLKFVQAFDALPEVLDSSENDNELNELDKHFYKVMDNDFNTPQALVVLSEYLDKGMAYCNQEQQPLGHRIINRVREHSFALGLFNSYSDLETVQNQLLAFQAINRKSQVLTVSSIEHLIHDRQQARHNKQYDVADNIRHTLHQAGIKVLDDAKNNTLWQFQGAESSA